VTHFFHLLAATRRNRPELLYICSLADPPRSNCLQHHDHASPDSGKGVSHPTDVRPVRRHGVRFHFFSSTLIGLVCNRATILQVDRKI